MSSKTCEHSDELLTLGAMRLLSAEEQARLDAQMRACPACRARFQEYRALAASLPQLTLLETAPLRAPDEQSAISLNGKLAHLPARVAAGKEDTDADADPERPLIVSLERRSASSRLVKVLSGLAAAVILAGVISGFWLLMLSHPPRSSQHPIITQPTQPTVITYNPCAQEIAKGVAVGGLPACGLMVMDYTPAPATLDLLDPTTGQPLDGLKPLPVGDATLAALSRDRLTLALGVEPNQSGGAYFIQIVALDTWKLGARAQLALGPNEALGGLAITPDGAGIYAVINDYSQAPIKATLQRYTYNRAQSTLTRGWSAPLPFAPGNGTLSGHQPFALSADGKTAYLFSAAINPPQLAAVPLKANGIGSPRILRLPSIAPGALPPASDENTTYERGDTIYQVYQPAVMFAPAQNKVYIVHAEAQDPKTDVLVVIDLAHLKILGPDIPIKGENLPAQTSAAAVDSGPLTMQPQRGLRPYKGRPYTGRNEVGALSPDGRWIYLSGSSFAPQFKSDGSWNGEQETDMGLLKIDTRTGQVVGRWFSGSPYSPLTFSQDGNSLYLFGPPPPSGQTYYSNTSALLVFDTTQDKLVGSFPNVDSGWFILTLP